MTPSFRLLHDAAGTVPPTQRRLLLVSHAFAPSRLVGALRWTRAVQLLADSGFGFDVVSCAPSAALATERGMLESLPAGTRVFGVDPLEPGPWRRLQTGLGTAVRWRRALGQSSRSDAPSVGAERAPTSPTPPPRSRPSLVRDAVRALSFLAQDEDEERWARTTCRLLGEALDLSSYAVIVSSGPPHAVHQHLDVLAQRVGRPHVVDLRDPWTHWSWVDGSKESPLFLERTRPRQAAVMRAAALVTTTSDRQTATLRAAYPDVAERIHTILNGTDDTPLPASTDDGVFRIAFTGVLYVDRNPATLFRAIRLFVDAVAASPAEVRVEFMGNVETFGNRRVQDIALEAGIAPWLTLTPPQPRAEAMALLARSHVLISFAEQLNETIAAKVFEYARFPAWLLLVGPEDSTTHDLLRGSEVLTAASEDVEGLAAKLRGAFDHWRRDGRPRPIAELLPLSRSTQVARLATLLERLTRADA